MKVQSGREESIKNALERRVKIEELEEYIGRILIPTEKVTELRNGKRVVKKRKKFPGYLMCEVEFNDKVLYLFRETSGVGDFVGGSLHKLPTPMNAREVERMLMDEDETPGGTKGGEEGDRQTEDHHSLRGQRSRHAFATAPSRTWKAKSRKSPTRRFEGKPEGQGRADDLGPARGCRSGILAGRPGVMV